jgi:hypothetical protein
VQGEVEGQRRAVLREELADAPREDRLRRN